MTNQILVSSLTEPSAVFTPDSIRDISGNFSSAIIGDTLSIDTFSPTVGMAIIFEVGFYTADDEPFHTADDDQFFTADTAEAPADETLAEGMVLFWKHGPNLKGKFYVREVTRTGLKTYQVTAYSAIGLLETVRHTGGIYTGQTAEAVLSEIIGTVFPYSVSADVAGQRVYGWLPVDTARNNLHKLLLALGINVTKDAAGDTVFEFVSAGTPTQIPEGRVFLGGSVRRESVASRVEVTEHTFIAAETGETVTVFDNTDASGYADRKTVFFTDAPVHSLTASAGLVVEESGPNYAIVSGVGTLTAKKYAHITQIIGMDNSSARQTNVKSVTGDTLISLINGHNVLKRLYDYYTRSDTIGADIKITTELPNQLLSLTDAFRDQRTAWLKSMDFRATTFIRASAQLIADYNPAHFGNLYTAVQRVTANRSWVVPPGTGRIRIVLIGGGSGGSGGFDGEDGHGGAEDYGGDMEYVATAETHGYYYANGGQPSGGAGGAGGEPGEPGKVYAIELDVDPGTVITLTVGSAGTGGARNGGAGTAGGATSATINGVTFTSENGRAAAFGVVDLISGAVYGKTSTAGLAGGDGGATDIVNYNGNGGYAGYSGNPVETWNGGDGGDGAIIEFDFVDKVAASGGGGGGAAYGASGGAGSDGTLQRVFTSYRAVGGDGGDGASASPPPNGGYGDAGRGGNGGGGGGNAGGSRLDRYWDPEDSAVLPGNGGAGGHGSRGGRGGGGIALIYYKGA